MGRPRKPTRLKIIEGNPGKRKICETEVQPTAPLAVPDIIAADPVADAEWRRVIASMPPGFFTDADAPMITLHCLAWRDLLAAHKVITAEGQTVTGSAGQPVPHPCFATIRHASAMLVTTSGQLGLSPSARARIAAPQPTPPRAPDPVDPEDDDLLRG